MDQVLDSVHILRQGLHRCGFLPNHTQIAAAKTHLQKSCTPCTLQEFESLKCTLTLHSKLSTNTIRMALTIAVIKSVLIPETSCILNMRAMWIKEGDT